MIVDKNEAASSCYFVDVPGFIGMHISKKVLKALSCDGIAHTAAKCSCEMELRNVLKLATNYHLVF